MPSGPIIYFFRGQIGARTPSRIGLGSGGPLRRVRRFLGLSRELWIQNFGGSWYWSALCWGPVLICIHRWKRPRMRCRRLRTSSTDPKRRQGHLRAANGQDFTTSAAPLRCESDRARRRFGRGSQKEVHGSAPTKRRRRATQEKATALEGHPPKRHPSRRSLRSRGSPVRSRPSCATRAALAAR